MPDFHNAAKIPSAGSFEVAAFEYGAKGLGMKALVASAEMEALG